MKPQTNDNIPINIQAVFYPIVKGAQCAAFPPYSTIKSCTTRVVIITKTNIELLKNPLKTLTSSFFNFLALISLKTCKKTKMLKNIV